MQHHGGILANGIQHHRVIKLGGHFADDMNGFGFKLLQMRQPGVRMSIAMVVAAFRKGSVRQGPAAGARKGYSQRRLALAGWHFYRKRQQAHKPIRHIHILKLTCKPGCFPWV